MNYVWELAIKAKRADIEQNSITYIFDDDFSPYLELSFVDLNEKGIPSKVAINPYYRYYIVFKELLNSDISMGDMEFKEMLLNIDFLRNNLPEELFKTIFFPEVSWDEKEFRELFAMLCLNSPRVEREVILHYLRDRLGYDKLALDIPNNEVHGQLVKALELVKRDGSPRRMARSQRAKIILD